MKLLVLCEGKLRERHFRTAQDAYLARLVHYAPVELREVERLRERDLPERSRVVALDQRGRESTSRELAAWLGKQLASSARGLCFVIGGADGIDAAVLARADEKLALSRLTLPHRLARVLLLEQLYRAMTILKGEPYHR